MGQIANSLFILSRWYSRCHWISHQVFSVLTRTYCYRCCEHSVLSSIMYSQHEWETIEIIILGWHKDARSLKDTVFQSLLVWLGEVVVKGDNASYDTWWWSWAWEGELSRNIFWVWQWWHYFEMRKIGWTSGNHSEGKMHWLWNNFINSEVLSHLWILKTVWERECSVRESCIGCEAAGTV